MSRDNPHANHRQRVRNRFKQTELDGFADHEIIEFLLFYAIPRRDTNELAHRLINTFGSLHNLFDASVEDIIRECEVSENTAVLLSLIPHVAKRYQLSKQGNNIFLDNPTEAGKYCIQLFINQTVEHFYVLCLNAKHQLIETVLLQTGTINEVHYYSREIVKVALRFHAVSIIVAHNHPSGNKTPSHEDVIATKEIQNILQTIDVSLLDHIVVGKETYFSMAEKRLMGFTDDYLS